LAWLDKILKDFELTHHPELEVVRITKQLLCGPRMASAPAAD
jgi:hypothetical protein